MRTVITTALILGATLASAETQTLKADIWVDNWFAMYANGTLVIEDSVSITTERSFNSETVTFEADMPITIAFEAKDFKENDTGLEYIGTRRQQMGDGGMIAQFKNAATGNIIAVTNSDMRCLVVHRAPLDRACAEQRTPVAGEGTCGFEVTAIPQGWTLPDFDDSNWPTATQHSVQAVSPKDGYDTISWNSQATLVWSDDLVQDNTLLCRMVIDQ
jgi:hypothetical protein